MSAVAPQSSTGAGTAIASSILERIGATPMVALRRPEAQRSDIRAEIALKLEFFNPLSSVKDRIGVAMIEAMERDGSLAPGAAIIEPTSGNTGVALAFVCAAKGYPLILCMPESMSIERRRLAQFFGARLELTPAHRMMPGAVERAVALLHSHGDAVMPQQFSNPANPAIHERSTAMEIWKDSGGRVDVVVAGVGTGGTLTGIGRALKPLKPALKLIAVEPEDSAVLSGRPPGSHKIQGIGPGFIPDNLDVSLIDETIAVGNEAAFAAARRAARLEGLPLGISSGAALAAALEVAARPEMRDALIVVIAPSSAERYLSTPLFDEG